MRSGLGRRTGAGAALVLAILVAAPASPAAAEAVITIDSPRADLPSESASVTVSGKAESANPLVNVVKRVTLTIKDKAPFTVECTAQPCPFKWTFSLPLNGPYEVSVAAVEAVQLLGTEGDTSRQVRRFAVAAPPARPVLDTPRVTASRAVELSWSRNTEPDMLYYAVFRRDPGAPRPFQVGGKVTQPPSGSRVTFTDTTTSGFSGGEYGYQVVAVRKGASGTAGTEKLSEPSPSAAAAVPAPPTTVSTAVPAPGTPGAGPATTVKPGPPAGVDLSGFLSSAQPVTMAPITVPEPPDTGFSGLLPFGAPLPSDELEEGEAEAVPPRDARGSSVVRIDAGRPLVPVAAGLVLLLLAMHLRVLGRRVKTPADNDLVVDLAPHTPAAAVPVPPPADDPAPHQDLYDIEAEVPTGSDMDWEEDWAAHAAEPEADPEPEAVPEAVPEPLAEVESEPVPEPELVAVAEVEPVPEPELVPVAAAGPVPEPEPEPVPVAAVEPVPEPELEVVELWAPPEPEPPAYDPDEIEIVEVVSSTRRPLARAGAR